MPSATEELVLPAQAVGRFMVLGRVGAGGMGQVYAAYDPVLDRRVALKLLHTERTARDREGLVREAKALARLSHPNVVAVHDVGVHEGLVFLAMEYIEGVTLKAWMSRPPKAQRDLSAALDLLLQAGDGLAAAHDAGLVHGDFKPHNVLVGEDGRVRVVDFGLARQERRTVPTTTTLGTSDGETSEDDSSRGIAGTPAYMAPEHARKGVVDPQTDQYSFCVSAWEVLRGARPPAVADDVELPAVVVSALALGLSRWPAGRHRSMAPLLDALRAGLAELRGDRSRRMRRYTSAGVAVAVLGAIAAGYQVGQAEERDSPCTGAETALEDVWSEDIRAEVEAAVLGTEVSYAQLTREVVLDRLDAFASAWVLGHRDACEASQVRREQSSDVMDMRMGCLEDRRREFGATVGVLLSLDAQDVENAVSLVEGLATPKACEDLAFVQERRRIPADPEVRESVAALRETLARADATNRAGHAQEALAMAREAVEVADYLGFDPVRAEAKATLGGLLDGLEQPEEATEVLEEAFVLAQATGQDPVAAQAALALSVAIGDRQHQLAGGLVWNDVALALANRVDGPERRLAARALSARSQIMHTHGDYVKSLALWEDAISRFDEDSLLYATALAGRGQTHASLGALEEALRDQEESLSIIRRRLGSDHPDFAQGLVSSSKALFVAGDFQRALSRVLQAKEIYASHQGPHGKDVGSCVSLIALLYLNLGELTKSLEAYDEALAILEKAFGTSHFKVAVARMDKSLALGRAFRTDEAVPLIRDALATIEATLGESHPMVTTGSMNLANLLDTAGRPEEAEAVYKSALLKVGDEAGPLPEAKIRANLAVLYVHRGDYERAAAEYDWALEAFRATTQGGDDYQRVLLNAAGVWLELGRAEEALEAGEELLASDTENPAMAARTQFLMARALWATKRDPTRAIEIGKEAEASYVALGAPPEDVDQVRRWLKAAARSAR